MRCRAQGIRWSRPPSELAAAVERYGDRVLQAVAAVAQYVATEMQNDAKRNASWTDRTGNARGVVWDERGGLRGACGDDHLSHSAVLDYGVFLELANGGRYAVIMRTMEAKYPELMSMLRETLG